MAEDEIQLDYEDLGIDPDLFDIKKLNAEEQALFKDFAMGEQAREFLDSDLGRLIRGFAIQEMKEADIELREVDPTNAALICQLQIKAARASQFLRFIQEAIQSGDQASEALIQNQE